MSARLALVTDPGPPFDADVPPVLRARLAAFGQRLGSMARYASPSQVGDWRDLLVEYAALHRDVARNLSDALQAASDGDVRPPAVAPAPEPEPEPTLPSGARVLDYPCDDCGGPIVRLAGARGRQPHRCDSCRTRPRGDDRWSRTAAYAQAHPEAGMRRCAKCGEVKPDDDANFQVKNRQTGSRASYCRPCRSAYSAERYVRAGARVITIELTDDDAAVGHACGLCPAPLLAGQRVQSVGQLVHQACADAAEEA